jgi:hypothetical protein
LTSNVTVLFANVVDPSHAVQASEGVDLITPLARLTRLPRHTQPWETILTDITIEFDVEEQRPSAVLDAMAQTPPTRLITVIPETFGELAAELGGMEQARVWIAGYVERHARLVALHLPHPDGTSTVAILGPSSWSKERLRGAVAVFYDDLIEAFGAAPEGFFDVE